MAGVFEEFIAKFDYF